MENIKDSEIIARLIYKAFCMPSVGLPYSGDDAVLTFTMAMNLYARTAQNEESKTWMQPALDEAECAALAEAFRSHQATAGPIMAMPMHDAPAVKTMIAPPERKLNGGKTTEEKRKIYARIMAFVETEGLGARRKIAEASGGALTVATIQDMTDAKPVPIELWRKAAKALERIEKEGQCET